MPQVTAQDIARECGVSQITVSRVFSGKGPVAVKTRERILKAADRLGYRPNALASGLRGGATQSIGLIAKGLGLPMAGQQIRHLIHAAQEQGYLTYALNIDHPGDDSATLARIARGLLDRRIDGLVIYRSMPVSTEVRQFLETCGVPVVFMGSWGPPRSQRRVALNLDASLGQLIDHLAELGHRRIAWFPSTGQVDFAEAKLRPLQRACSKAGIEMVMDPRWWIDGSSSHVADAAYEATRSFLADGPLDVTALLVINDVGALGSLAALREAGLSVPDDLSVVGFDNMDGSQYFEPPLTTIRAPSSEDIGLATFQMLHALVTDPAAKVERCDFPFELVVRKSTGPARPGALKLHRQRTCSIDR